MKRFLTKLFFLTFSLLVVGSFPLGKGVQGEGLFGVLQAYASPVVDGSYIDFADDCSASVISSGAQLQYYYGTFPDTTTLIASIGPLDATSAGIYNTPDKLWFQMVGFGSSTDGHCYDNPVNNAYGNGNYYYRYTYDGVTWNMQNISRTSSTAWTMGSYSGGGSGVVEEPDYFGTCSSLDIGCYLKNAFYWLFVVKQSTLQQFQTLTLENSLPFSYIYDMGNLYDELFANTGTAEISIGLDTAIGHMQFISPEQLEAVPFASTVKSILGFLMYFFTAFAVYRIIKGVFSQNHA